MHQHVGWTDSGKYITVYLPIYLHGKPLLSEAEVVNVVQGKSGVSQIESFSCEDYSTRFAGEIKGFQCNGFVSKKNERRMDNCIKYTMVAGKKVHVCPQGLAPCHAMFQGSKNKPVFRAPCMFRHLIYMRVSCM